MSVFSETVVSPTAPDFELGIPGFRFSDLFDAVKLAELAETFYQHLERQEPVTGQALKNMWTLGVRGSKNGLPQRS